MRRKLLLLLLLSGLFLVYTPVANAEEEQKVRVLEAELIKDTPGSEIEQKVRIARKLIKKKDYEGASALLEMLYEQDRERQVVVNLLFICYNRLGYLLKAEALSRRLVERNPESYINRLRLAEILAKQARLDEAETAYREAVSLISHDDVPRYRTILQSMIGHGFETMALTLIDTARARLVDPALFAIDRGEILERQNAYRQASEEFFTALEDTSGKTASNAEKKLLALLDYPESSAEVEKALMEQTNVKVNARAAKILSTFYLKEERFDRAFDFAVMQDSLEGRKGSSLLNFMRSCRERKLYHQLARMAEHILSRYDNHPIIGETYFLYGNALVRLGRFDDAIATYDTVFATFPRVQDKAEALYIIGDIHLNYLNDCPRALIFFDSVINHYNAGLGYLNAKLAVPYCFLRQGILDKAGSTFAELLTNRLDENNKEAVEYNLALILFFEKKFDSSMVAFRKLLVDYPRGFYVNDALQLLLLLEEAKGAPKLLYDFSNALLFEQMRIPDSTATKLLLIVNNSSRALADVALYKLAELSLSRADSTAAIEFIEQLAEEFPESYYLPYGMKAEADIYLNRPDGVEQAKSIYRRLLEEYPNYPFISEVRKTMRQLEGEA
jgi:tetratricopeptide (TPR) repeat protein